MIKSRATAEKKSENADVTIQLREQFQKKRTIVGEIEIHHLSVGIFWLLEEIKHPFSVTTKPGEKRTLTMRDTAHAIFIFNNPDRAMGAFQEGKNAFDIAAAELANQIPISDLTKIISEIIKMFEGSVTAAPQPAQ